MTNKMLAAALLDMCQRYPEWADATPVFYDSESGSHMAVNKLFQSKMSGEVGKPIIMGVRSIGR